MKPDAQTSTMVDPPDRIVTDRLALRRWEAGDAPALCEAVTESIDHLRPWMPWAMAAPTVEEERSFIASSLEAWNAGREFVYGIFLQNRDAIVGGCGFHCRIGPDALEIGYWIHAAHIRRGYASEAVSALVRTAWQLPGIRRVEVHCDLANMGSAAIPRRLGFHLDRVIDEPREAPAEVGRTMIWVFPREPPPKG